MTSRIPGLSSLSQIITCYSAVSVVSFSLAAGPASAAETEPAVEKTPEAIGSLDEFDSLNWITSKVSGENRLVLGDVHGFVHVYEISGESLQEIWISEYLEGPIGGIFITDINHDQLDEIVVYTDAGRLHFLDIEDYSTIWSNPPNEYERITAMYVYDVDDDVQDELLFCADGRLIVYDGRDQFEEWRSDQDNLRATDILVGDVDGDGDEEIVLKRWFRLRCSLPRSRVAVVAAIWRAHGHARRRWRWHPGGGRRVWRSLPAHLRHRPETHESSDSLNSPCGSACAPRDIRSQPRTISPTHVHAFAEGCFY